MINDFVVIRRDQVGQLACLLFILTVTYTYKERYVPSLSAFVTQDMSCLLIPFPCKMCDGQSHVFVLTNTSRIVKAIYYD